MERKAGHQVQDGTSPDYPRERLLDIESGSGGVMQAVGSAVGAEPTDAELLRRHADYTKLAPRALPILQGTTSEAEQRRLSQAFVREDLRRIGSLLDEISQKDTPLGNALQRFNRWQADLTPDKIQRRAGKGDEICIYEPEGNPDGGTLVSHIKLAHRGGTFVNMSNPGKEIFAFTQNDTAFHTILFTPKNKSSSPSKDKK